jgi:NADPH-dependent curcumin reductase CurA
MNESNHQIRLAQRPHGVPGPEVWEHATAAIEKPQSGQILVEVQYLSLDPAMRGWITDARSYMPPVALGDVMRAGGAGRVVASADERFAEGDLVTGMTGVQEYALLPADVTGRADPAVAPLPRFLSALGSTGMTAYFGLLEIGRPQAGETVVVSGAAGAVGSVAGQIARIKGCRTVGIAGGPDKCRWLTDELGFDAAIDYRAAPGAVAAGLREHAPNGIDVYFDNVGGEILDAALARLARRARIVLCGGISQYNATDRMRGPANYMSLVVNRARMEGFLVFDYAARYGDAARELAGWLADGSLVAREDIVDGGVDAFPEVLLRLFRAENTGKLLLRVRD